MSKLAKALTAAAGNAGGDNLYVEDVFSTYVYEGSGAARTIANGIPLSDEGGLVWLKQRGALDSHVLFDTVNGPQKSLASNDTAAGANYSSYLSFPSAGTAGWNLAGAILNGTGTTWASWTFRKAEKFFDVVTYTGNGTAGRTVAHNLGSVPAVIIVKSTSNGAYNWMVYHKDLGNTNYLRLNETTQTLATAGAWNNTTPTDSEFTLGGASVTNGNGESFVAYLFASDAGGYGDDGSENIIKCGSVTTDGSGNASVDVGFEPQWCLWKCIDAAGGNEHGNWRVNDVMRGWPAPSASNAFGYPSSLYANTNGAETISGVDGFIKSATGFGFGQVQANKTYIYIAIRRPMKTPEAGTEVFDAVTRTATNPNLFATALSYVDVAFNRNLGTAQTQVTSRLTGGSYLHTASSAAEVTPAAGQIEYDYNYKINPYWWGFSAEVDWLFKRATGFMDVVAYTGNGTAGRTVAHNLSVVPELMIVKNRTTSGYGWGVYSTPVGNTAMLQLNTTAVPNVNSVWWNNTTPTDSVFTVGANQFVNENTDNYIAYLFASVAGVSKVGSYTGTAADLNVDCGFSAGARFILIKRTDSTGDWYVWDSERGIVAGNDPYLLLNSTAAQVTNTDYIDPLASGFTVTASASSTVNVSSGTYIFLAIA